MSHTTVYLNFDGNCREAMAFYHGCLGGELQVMTFGEGDFESPPGAEGRIMHAAITKGAAPLLMASDTMPGESYQAGNSVYVMLACDSDGEVDDLFGKLSAGGRPMMEPQDTFWNAHFAMFRDRFGINWMLNHEKGQQG